MNITMKIKYLSIFPIVIVLVLSGFSFANAQSDVFTQNLYYGLQNNSQVTQLQEFLTSQNLYSGPITGNYYFLTIGAVKAFQTQQGITPAAGYFGPITMAAANKIANTTVSASNNEAITETGTSTPSIASASSTAQLQLAALMQEVALLEQQLQAQQSSTQALQSIQTQVQQIASNTQSIATASPACPQYSIAVCGTNSKTYYGNSCLGYGMPATVAVASQGACIAPSQTCTPNWQCNTWSACSSSQQSRTCSDSNNCGVANGEPLLTQSCSMPTPTSSSALNNDDTLSSLNVNGTLISGFSPATLSYNDLLPAGTTAIPVITATTNNANATKVIYQTTATTGSATVTVTAQNRTATQTYTINFAVLPTLTITMDTSVHVPTYVVAGSTGNTLIGFDVTTNSSAGVSLAGSNITITDNISNNSNGASSFENLTLWQGTTEISGPAQMNIGSNGVGTIVFPLGNSSALVTQNNTPLAFQIHGDVNALTSSATVLKSLHSFGVIGSSVVGSWQYQNSPVSITASGNVSESNIVILPYYATLDASGGGNSNNTVIWRNITVNDNIGTITLEADPIETGSATVNSFTLEFSGTGLFNQYQPSHLGTFIVALVGSGGNTVDSETCTPVVSVTGQQAYAVGTGSCSVTFPINTSLSSGNSVSYTLETPNPIIQKTDTGNGYDQNVLLFLNDVDWTDGKTPDIHWSASNQPSQMFSYTYE